jgi:protein SCO1
MADLTRRALLAGTATTSVALGLGLGSMPHSEKKSFAHWQNIPPREIIRRRHFPNVEVFTHQNAKLRFYDDLIRDKKVILNFMFTSCQNACPLVTANLVKVQRLLHDRIGRDIQIYSITLDPEMDSPGTLRDYAAAHHIGPGWLFLTGKPQDMELLRRSLGFVQRNPLRDADKTQHIGVIRFGTEACTRWAACPGLAPADWVATSILSEMDSPLKGAVKS